MLDFISAWHRNSLIIAGRLTQYFQLHRSSVLCLHSVTPYGQKDVFAGSMSVTDRFLDQLIGDFKRRNIEIVSLSEAVRRLETRDKSVFVSLTFDDGYRDNFYYAYPVLRKYNVPFTVFLTTGLVDQSYPMWWHALEKGIMSTTELKSPDGHYDTGTLERKQEIYRHFREAFLCQTEEDQETLLSDLAKFNPAIRLDDGYTCALTWQNVREMADSGLAEFGCHTISHPMLGRLDASLTDRQVSEPKLRIRNATGVDPAFFAYPFGQHFEVGLLAPERVRKAGFKAAFTTHSRPLRLEDTKTLHSLPRITVSASSQNLSIVAAHMSGAPAFFRRLLETTRWRHKIAPVKLQSAFRFSLVVATIGKQEPLQELLESLSQQHFTDFEVIIVDQSRDREIEGLVSRFQDSLNIIRLTSDRGLSKARNTGIAGARGQIVAFPDDDCCYAPQVLGEVDRIFRENPQLGGMTGRCSEIRNNQRHSIDIGTLNPVTKRNVWARAISSSIFLDRSVFNIAGGFDENLGLGARTEFQSGEETDMLLRVIEHGYELKHHPDLIIYHPETNPFDRGAVLKAWAYGLGAGRVLRIHKYNYLAVLAHILRPLGGSLTAFLMNRKDLAKIRWARGFSRFEGWRWKAGPRHRHRHRLIPPDWIEKGLARKQAADV